MEEFLPFKTQIPANNLRSAGDTLWARRVAPVQAATPGEWWCVGEFRRPAAASKQAAYLRLRFPDLEFASRRVEGGSELYAARRGE